ncbi:hypothetical protein ACK39S_20095 [Aeromonas veronii]
MAQYSTWWLYTKTAPDAGRMISALQREQPKNYASPVVMPETTQMNKCTGVKRKLNVVTAAQLCEQVLSLSTWLTAQQVSDNAGYKGANASELPNKWKKAGQIFTISVGGKDLFPAYGFGINGKPLPKMKEILAILAAHRTALVIASWFVSANSWLGGKTPMNELAERPLNVLKAARMEVTPIEHG